MEDYSNLISVFSNSFRVKILLLLDKNEFTLTELTTNIGDTSHPEISRHLGRLTKQSLIIKESGRKYKLTPFGRSVISIFKPLNFLFKNGNYFKNHMLNSLPDYLLRDIHMLKTSKIISGTGAIMFKMQNLAESANKEIWLMVNNSFPFKWNVEKANLLIPHSMLDRESEARKMGKKFRVGILSTVSVSITLSDLNQGLIFFPRPKETDPDYNEGFFVIDKDGIEYLRKIWDYFWKKSKKIIKEF